MKKTMISLMASAAIFAACAEERITYPASDKVTVYRLELHSDAQGNEAAYVVGVDGVSRPVVLVEPMKYKLLTERLDAMWQSYHATADGRRRLHGKVKQTVVDEKALKKIEIHEDGYSYEETMTPKRRPQEKKTKLAAKIGLVKPAHISKRQWEMRKRLMDIREGKGKTVTLEHDAATGKNTITEVK